MNRQDDAIAVYEEARRLFPENPKTTFSLITIFQVGQTRIARDYEDLLDVSFGRPTPHLFITFAFIFRSLSSQQTASKKYGEGKYAESLADYLAIEKLLPDNADVVMNIGNIYVR